MAYTHYYVSALAGGGGTGTEVSPFTLEEARLAAGPGLWFHVKGDATYNLSANWTPAAAGTYDSPCVWQGYTTTINDGGMATLSFSSSYFVLLNTANGYYHYFQGISVLGGTSAAYCWYSHFSNNFYRCKATVRRTTGACQAFSSGNCILCYCDCNNTSYTHIGYVPDSFGHTLNSVANGLPIGVSLGSRRYKDICNNIIIGTGTSAGIAITESGTGLNVSSISNNLILNHQYGISFSTTSPSFSYVANIEGNVFYDCDYGIYVNGSWQYSWLPRFQRNAFGAITTANYSGFSDNFLEAMRFNDIQLTESPFRDYAGGDYRLNDAAGGGALCRNIAVPLLDGVHTTYVDLGAIGPKEDYPAVSNVTDDSGTYKDGLLTGTYSQASESDVREGTSYGAGGTEYTGTLVTGAIHLVSPPGSVTGAGTIGTLIGVESL